MLEKHKNRQRPVVEPRRLNPVGQAADRQGLAGGGCSASVRGGPPPLVHPAPSPRRPGPVFGVPRNSPRGPSPGRPESDSGFLEDADGALGACFVGPSIMALGQADETQLRVALRHMRMVVSSRSALRMASAFLRIASASAGLPWPAYIKPSSSRLMATSG